ncbi:MAG: hypothetical protein ABF479_15570 [Gluconacetobacter sp.]|uniref:Uncharacterized protein n=1 Tax=Gluconacetobacter dulcium TaxID=2729096 RepID=A0A7W4JYS5_9PROT|nr:hypothetical protein [Gluconacetobacter dulcium]MBB2197174.1 hypothetical protein [Gluconacetobacter dulcium]
MMKRDLAKGAQGVNPTRQKRMERCLLPTHAHYRLLQLSSGSLACLCSAVLWCSGALATPNPSFEPSLKSGDVFSNAFSIQRSVTAPGYQEFVWRNGGTADYRVTKATTHGIEFDMQARYDGRPIARHHISMTPSGDRFCIFNAAKIACESDRDASGLLFNQAVWGRPLGALKSGSYWHESHLSAWEFGGAGGSQDVIVTGYDITTGAITLSRAGSAEGFYSENDPTTITLLKDGHQKEFHLRPGHTSWRGVTIIKAGIVLSDEIIVERDDVLVDDGNRTVTAHERRIMLENAAPFPTIGLL